MDALEASRASIVGLLPMADFFDRRYELTSDRRQCSAAIFTNCCWQMNSYIMALSSPSAV